jgi:hypothetical protein
VGTKIRMAIEAARGTGRQGLLRAV